MSKFTRVSFIDVENNPLFERILGAEGFKRLDEAGLDAFLAQAGLKFVIFADDPNTQKETMDIVVIGPEVAKSCGRENFVDCYLTSVQQGRALGARWGIKKLPAIALFRDQTYLGAVEGLTGWEDYIRQLADISLRTQAPPRTISILSAKPEPTGCHG